MIEGNEIKSFKLTKNELDLVEELLRAIPGHHDSSKLIEALTMAAQVTANRDIF